MSRFSMGNFSAVSVMKSDVTGYHFKCEIKITTTTNKRSIVKNTANVSQCCNSENSCISTPTRNLFDEPVKRLSTLS